MNHIMINTRNLGYDFKVASVTSTHIRKKKKKNLRVHLNLGRDCDSLDLCSSMSPYASRSMAFDMACTLNGIKAFNGMKL